MKVRVSKYWVFYAAWHEKPGRYWGYQQFYYDGTHHCFGLWWFYFALSEE